MNKNGITFNVMGILSFNAFNNFGSVGSRYLLVNIVKGSMNNFGYVD